MPKGPSKKKKRIGHVYGAAPVMDPAAAWDAVPRGWIHPSGKFVKTKEHWKTICSRLGERKANPAEVGERFAHRAYAEGWISLGHGGVFNAVGHRSTFEKATHPALETLRKLVTQSPHFALRIERQFGKIDPESGRHADFDVKEYDLDLFIKRGRLKKA